MGGASGGYQIRARASPVPQVTKDQQTWGCGGRASPEDTKRCSHPLDLQIYCYSLQAVNHLTVYLRLVEELAFGGRRKKQTEVVPTSHKGIIGS